MIDLLLQLVLVRGIPSLFTRGAEHVDHRWYAIQTTSGHENKVRSLDPAKNRSRSAAAGGAPDPSGARSDAGSRRDQERQEGQRRAEDLPRLRARRDGDEPGDAAHASTASRASSSSSATRSASRIRSAPTRSTACSVSRRKTSRTQPKEEIPFLVGQAVAITEGPFTDFNGTVEEVLADKGKVRVSVSLFGRPTTVELDYLQSEGLLERVGTRSW